MKIKQLIEREYNKLLNEYNENKLVLKRIKNIYEWFNNQIESKIYTNKQLLQFLSLCNDDNIFLDSDFKLENIIRMFFEGLDNETIILINDLMFYVCLNAEVSFNWEDNHYKSFKFMRQKELQLMKLFLNNKMQVIEKNTTSYLYNELNNKYIKIMDFTDNYNFYYENVLNYLVSIDENILKENY